MAKQILESDSTALNDSVEMDDLDRELSKYQKQLDINESETDSDDSGAQNSDTNTANEKGGSTNWQGNPAYFQTGKKAGTLRPSMSHKAPAKETMEISGTLIDGAMFIMLVDMLFPLLIVVANNKMSKTQIEIEDIQLSEKQKKDLAPLADEVCKQLTLQANPAFLLLVGLGGIYGINFMVAKKVAEK